MYGLLCFFFKVFNIGDNFDSKLRQFHIFAALYEKHFLPFADFCMGISNSGLVLRNSLLHVSESLLRKSFDYVSSF